MNSRAALEAKKRQTPVSVPRPDRDPAQHPLFSRHAAPAAERSFSNHSTCAASSHDFNRIPVQYKDQTAEPQRGSCPLVSAAGPRACPFGGACHACPVRVQPKLAESQKGDAYEREADLLAEYVMSGIQTGPEYHGLLPVSSFPWKSDSPNRSSEINSQPERNNELTSFPYHIQEVLQTPGEPLKPMTRDVMQSCFGKDLGSVRIHSDAKAAISSKKENANAYTIGPHIVFAEGQYRPDLEKGQFLLAHELTHVLQQNAGNYPSNSPPIFTKNPIIFRQEGTTSSPVDKERVWGFWVTRSMCGCVPLIKEAIKSTNKAMSFYRECDLPIYSTGTEIQTCFEEKACGGHCNYVGETPASGCLEVPPVPSNPCEKILHRGTWNVHEVFHQRQGDRIARGLGSDFWREWKKLEGNCDRLNILSQHFPSEVEAYNAEWNDARGWVQGEIESYTREQQFYYDVHRALKRICVT